MDKVVATGPDIPGVNFRGQDWGELENWLKENRAEIYARLAKETTSWEETLVLRGRASFIDKMLDLPNTAAILGRV